MATISVLLSLGILVAQIGVSLCNDYTLWCLGNCDKDISTDSVPGAVLMGGGTDTNEAFAWQIQHANKGDFVILRTSGDDAYNEYVYDMSIAIGEKLNSVTTILFKRSSGAKETEVLDTIRNAEAIFFAGGDQSVYMDYWMDTEVQSIIQSKLNSTTVGGTSAGLAVLGNWVYSAEEGSVYSDEALENPYNKYVTITSPFLKIPFLDTIITDTHFVTRDRMGRLLTFVARIEQDGWYTDDLPVRGLGVDEHTALLLDVTTGDVLTVGVGTAYVCSSTPLEARICLEDTPLTLTSQDCIRLSGEDQDQYSFASFKGSGVVYTNDIKMGHFTSLPYGPRG